MLRAEIVVISKIAIEFWRGNSSEVADYAEIATREPEVALPEDENGQDKAANSNKQYVAKSAKTLDQRKLVHRCLKNCYRHTWSNIQYKYSQRIL